MMPKKPSKPPPGLSKAKANESFPNCSSAFHMALTASFSLGAKYKYL